MFRFLWAGLFIALSACASTSSRGLRADSEGPVLLTASGALELHVRDGRIVEVYPAVETREGKRERQIRTLDELRASWQSVTGGALPEEDPRGQIEVNGWAGLECVRRGESCGRAPEEPARALVKIRIR
ncbi:MAG TPA: hypothetical protein PK095_20505 [Myxococcota bacterium]|nr:hypothetical protein [Myxococcota bacterium]